MTDTNYKYQKEMDYLPFKKRFIKAARPMFIIQAVILILFTSISFKLSLLFLFLLAFCAIALVTALFAYRIRKRVVYFLKGIRITNDHIANLELYRKDERFDHQLNLESLDVVLGVSGGGRHGRLTFTIEFFYDGQLLGKQSDLGKWKSSLVKELFSTIKNFKGETLTAKEARLLKMKRSFLR